MRALAIAAALTAAIVLPCASRAEEALDLPTRIVLTEEDCREINKKRTLKGRPVDSDAYIQWKANESVWQGLRVLSGRKADVIGWFRTASFRRPRSQYEVFMAAFQYDMLVSKLLQTRDVDITRAILYHGDETGPYTAPEWRAVMRDNRLASGEQIRAFRLAFCSPWRNTLDRQAAEEFWHVLGDSVTTDDIVGLDVVCRFPWRVFYRYGEPSPPVSSEKARELLRPLLSLEYLRSHNHDIVSDALYALNEVLGYGDSALRDECLQKLIAWDKMGEERSHLLWAGVGVRELDAATARRVRDFAFTARLPSNAASAFFNYPKTTLGTREVRKTGGGWQRHFEEYFKMAFGKATREEQLAFLHALSSDLDPNTGLPEISSLNQWLREGNVALFVTKEQWGLLKEAWRYTPEALKHVVAPVNEEKGKGPEAVEIPEKPKATVRVLGDAPGSPPPRREEPPAALAMAKPAREPVIEPVKPPPREEPQPVAAVSSPGRFGTWELLTGLAAGIVIGGLAVALIRRRRSQTAARR